MSVESRLLEYLPKLVEESAVELMEIYDQRKKGCFVKRKTKIIFPKYRKKKHEDKDEYRISEQELRFVMTGLLEKNNDISDICYSVETPTEDKYRFSGKNYRSASTDLTLYYCNEKKEKKINIELKAHNATLASINKDIEKLLNEPYCGLWVHLLVNEDSGTIRALFDKFKTSFEKKKHKKLLKERSKELSISFYVMVLGTSKILCKTMKGAETIDDFFDFEYLDKKSRKIKKQKINGWQVEVL